MLKVRDYDVTPHIILILSLIEVPQIRNGSYAHLLLGSRFLHIIYRVLQEVGGRNLGVGVNWGRGVGQVVSSGGNGVEWCVRAQLFEGRYSRAQLFERRYSRAQLCEGVVLESATI